MRIYEPDWCLSVSHNGNVWVNLWEGWINWQAKLLHLLTFQRPGLLRANGGINWAIFCHQQHKARVERMD
jgi:hypothetical protein